jgi:hypothetical protein
MCRDGGRNNIIIIVYFENVKHPYHFLHPCGLCWKRCLSFLFVWWCQSAWVTSSNFHHFNFNRNHNPLALVPDWPGYKRIHYLLFSTSIHQQKNYTYKACKFRKFHLQLNCTFKTCCYFCIRNFFCVCLCIAVGLQFSFSY